MAPATHLQCKECSYTCRLLDPLQDHYRRLHPGHSFEHSDDDDESCPKSRRAIIELPVKGNVCTELPAEDGSFPCLYCDFSSNELAASVTHVNVVHYRVQRYKCPECTFANYYQYAVSQHLDVSHSHNCDVCFEQFDSRNALLAHEKKKCTGQPRPGKQRVQTNQSRVESKTPEPAPEKESLSPPEKNGKVKIGNKWMDKPMLTPKNQFQCSECMYKADAYNTIIKHMSFVHDDDDDEDEDSDDGKPLSRLKNTSNQEDEVAATMRQLEEMARNKNKKSAGEQKTSTMKAKKRPKNNESDTDSIPSEDDSVEAAMAQLHESTRDESEEFTPSKEHQSGNEMTPVKKTKVSKRALALLDATSKKRPRRDSSVDSRSSRSSRSTTSKKRPRRDSSVDSRSSRSSRSSKASKAEQNSMKMTPDQEMLVSAAMQKLQAMADKKKKEAEATEVSPNKEVEGVMAKPDGRAKKSKRRGRSVEAEPNAELTIANATEEQKVETAMAQLNAMAKKKQRRDRSGEEPSKENQGASSQDQEVEAAMAQLNDRAKKKQRRDRSGETKPVNETASSELTEEQKVETAMAKLKEMAKKNKQQNRSRSRETKPVPEPASTELSEEQKVEAAMAKLTEMAKKRQDRDRSGETKPVMKTARIELTEEQKVEAAMAKLTEMAKKRQHREKSVDVKPSKENKGVSSPNNEVEYAMAQLNGMAKKNKHRGRSVGAKPSHESKGASSQDKEAEDAMAQLNEMAKKNKSKLTTEEAKSVEANTTSEASEDQKVEAAMAQLKEMANKNKRRHTIEVVKPSKKTKVASSQDEEVASAMAQLNEMAKKKRGRQTTEEVHPSNNADSSNEEETAMALALSKKKTPRNKAREAASPNEGLDMTPDEQEEVEAAMERLKAMAERKKRASENKTPEGDQSKAVAAAMARLQAMSRERDKLVTGPGGVKMTPDQKKKVDATMQKLKTVAIKKERIDPSDDSSDAQDKEVAATMKKLQEMARKKALMEKEHEEKRKVEAAMQKLKAMAAKNKRNSSPAPVQNEPSPMSDEVAAAMKRLKAMAAKKEAQKAASEANNPDQEAQVATAMKQLNAMAAEKARKKENPSGEPPMTPQEKVKVDAAMARLNKMAKEQKEQKAQEQADNQSSQWTPEVKAAMARLKAMAAGKKKPVVEEPSSEADIKGEKVAKAMAAMKKMAQERDKKKAKEEEDKAVAEAMARLNKMAEQKNKAKEKEEVAKTMAAWKLRAQEMKNKAKQDENQAVAKAMAKLKQKKKEADAAKKAEKEEAEEVQRTMKRLQKMAEDKKTKEQKVSEAARALAQLEELKELGNGKKRKRGEPEGTTPVQQPAKRAKRACVEAESPSNVETDEGSSSSPAGNYNAEIQRRFRESMNYYDNEKQRLLEELVIAKVSECPTIAETGCKYSTVRKSLMQAHYISAHTSLRRFQCLTCDNYFTTGLQLRNHFASRSVQHCLEAKEEDVDEPGSEVSEPEPRQEEEMTAKKTSEVNPTQQRYIQHESMFNAKVQSFLTEGGHIRARPLCPVDGCDFRSKQANTICNHVGKVHAGVQRFSCFECGEVVPRQSQLLSHYKSFTEKQCLQKRVKRDAAAEEAAKDSATSSDSNQSESSLRFSRHESAFELTKHDLLSDVPPSESPEICPVPDCTFLGEDEVAVDDHLMVEHFDLPRYKCQECGKVEKSEAELKNHFRTSTEQECLLNNSLPSIVEVRSLFTPADATDDTDESNPADMFGFYASEGDEVNPEYSERELGMWQPWYDLDAEQDLHEYSEDDNPPRPMNLLNLKKLD